MPLKSMALLFTLTMVIVPATVAEPTIPPSSWQQLSGDIELALILKKQSITIYIKNTSKTHKEVLNQGSALAVQLFYLDDRGAQILLGNHHDPNLDDVALKNSGPIVLPPDGEVSMQVSISITSDELVLIKAHPVICSMLIYDPATKQKYTIESTPKLLTEIPSK